MKLTKKGMTLFELLAVIVILGIIAAIAFPTVGSLINNTKKDTFAGNANNFVSYAITQADSAYAYDDTNTTYKAYFGTTTDTAHAAMVADADAVNVSNEIPTTNPFGSTPVWGYITITITVNADGSTTKAVTGTYSDGTNTITITDTQPLNRDDVQ